MSASFEEKSVWVQLAAMVLTLAGYLYVAGSMMASGVRALPAYAAVFMVSVVVMVVLLVAGYIVAAVSGRVEGRDERDRLIEWRAEHRSGWVLGLGVMGAVTAMVMSVEAVWVAHGLILSLYASEMLSSVLRLVAYRRGV